MKNVLHAQADRRRTIGLAVSGGADSTALLSLMAGLQETHGFRAVVLHVDHGLRNDSADDARFVRELAERFDLPFHFVRVRITKKRGESIEMAARRARLAFFAKMTRKLGLDAIATGHHADDVAETFILRMARGSGPEGLAGLKPISRVDGITFIRPLLNVRDSALRAYLVSQGIGWREDSTNSDTSIPRNNVRHVILPFLRKHLDPRITEHLCKSAAILRGDLVRPQHMKKERECTRRNTGNRAVPSFTMEISPAVGFERRPESVGMLPASCELDRAALARRNLEIRTWRPGDRIAPVGLGGHSRKLQDVFVTAKTPAHLRKRLPVLADADTGEVLWVPGYRMANCVAVASSSSPSWRFTLTEE